jgi:transposase
MPGPLPTSALTLSAAPDMALPHLSACSTAPCAQVPRARILLLAPQPPAWRHADLARKGGCAVHTVQRWRQRWQTTDALQDAPRPGGTRTLTPLQRAQLTARACRAPREYGKPWRRWSGATRAHVAVEPQLVTRSAPGTLRPWLRQAQSNPWREHAWQPAPAPPCVEKAAPGRARSQQAQALAAPGAAGVCCSAAQPAMQARQRVSPTTAAAPGWPVHGAARSKRLGAVQVCGARVGASGGTFARTCGGTPVSDCTAVLRELCQRALCAGLQVIQLMLEKGSTHAPKPWGPWMASLALSCAVTLDWLPTQARGLEQVELIFSQGQRDLLTPNALPSTLALEKDLQHYLAERNGHPTPLQWTYTKTKLLAKCGAPQPAQLAA